MQTKGNLEMRRKDFIFWSNEFLGLKIEDNEEFLIKTLLRIGITVDSIFIETDIQKLRLYLSDLILKAHQYEISSTKEYIYAINFLTCYIGFLERYKIDLQNTKEINEKTNDSLTVAYYLSRANKIGVELLGYKSFSEAFSEIALILGNKSTTIKNMRDQFDPYFENGRKGWYQRELSTSRKLVYKKYSNISIDELTVIVKEILLKYSHNNDIVKEKDTKTKIIKIRNNNMKVIKRKK